MRYYIIKKRGAHLENRIGGQKNGQICNTPSATLQRREGSRTGSLQNVRERITENSRGFTVEGIVSGEWVDKGAVYRDKPRKYSIAVEENKLENLLELLRTTGKRLEQLAMYYEVDRVTEINFLEIER